MKKSNGGAGKGTVDLDRMVTEITTDAHGDDEELRAFHQALEGGVEFPCDAFVIGEPVSVMAFDYYGNPRRGIGARCRRKDGSEHLVAAADLVPAPHSRGADLLAAYRKWLGFEPKADQVATPARRKHEHKVGPGDLDLSQAIELVVLSIKDRAARCRLPGTDRVVSLRASRLWDIVPR